MGLWNNDSYDNGDNGKDNGSWYVDEPDNGVNPAPGSDPSSDPAGNGDGNIHRIYIHIEPNTMLYTVSCLLGILTVATAILGTVYLPFMLGGIAIVMAVLSRQEDGTMHIRAKIGALVASIGIVLNIVIVGSSIYSVLHDPEQYEAFDSMFEKVYGEDFESFLESNGLPSIESFK